MLQVQVQFEYHAQKKQKKKNKHTHPHTSVCVTCSYALALFPGLPTTQFITSPGASQVVIERICEMFEGATQEGKEWQLWVTSTAMCSCTLS